MSNKKNRISSKESNPILDQSVLKKRLLFLFIFLCLLSISQESGSTPTKPESSDIVVHVVPHTHDDVGWNWTFDEYYLGNGGSKASVKHILDNFIESLYDRTDRTFIYVEIAFFSRWYGEQNEIKKTKVKNLLREGRFEFINGGYVMHDEASSYYQHTIDQMRLGLMFLKQEFDFVPEIAWFIDPFGHSASNAYILAKMGFKKIALVRIDYREKNYRKKNKTLEFFYVPFGQIDENVKIFTHVTHDHYCPPAALDTFILDQSVKMDPNEVKSRSESLIAVFKDMRTKFLHKNALLMYGCDFTHNARDINFANLETIMDYINNEKNGSGVKFIYSTPTRYFDTIFSQVEQWPDYKNYDFFPYADSEWSTWTGFFTSRPYLKGMVRETGNYLSAISQMLFKIILKNNFDRTAQAKIDEMSQEKLVNKPFLTDLSLGKNYLSFYFLDFPIKGQLENSNSPNNNISSKNNVIVLSNNNNTNTNNNNAMRMKKGNDSIKTNCTSNATEVPKTPLEVLVDEAIDKLFVLRERHAISQHHDAVAGTSKEYVSQDYVHMLEEAIKDSKTTMIKIIKYLRNDSDIDLKICMDPTVDYRCLEEIFTFPENKKLFVKVKNFDSTRNDSITENFEEQKSKETFKEFDIGHGYRIENYNFWDKTYSTGKTEMFCLDELKNKTLNCKVYFKSQNKFFISKKIGNNLYEDKLKLNAPAAHRKFISEPRAQANMRNSRKKSAAENHFSNIPIPKHRIERNYFRLKNGTIPQTQYFVSDYLKLNYSEKENQLTFELKPNEDFLYNTPELNLRNQENHIDNRTKYIFQLYHGYYKSYNGTNSNLRPKDSCPSGAYILSTTQIEPNRFDFIPEKSYIEKGEFYTRIVMRFSQSYIVLAIENDRNHNQESHIPACGKNVKEDFREKFRINRNQNPNNYFQIESIWDPIPDTSEPKEYLLIVNTDIDNNVIFPDGSAQPEFWTDSNGIKMMRRFKDFREGYDYEVTDPVAGNFYPVNSMLSLRDRKNYQYLDHNKDDDYIGMSKRDKMFTYLNDRSQSVGVMKKGQIIVIQNRQSYRDDYKGLEEVIHENYSFYTHFKLRNYLVFGGDEETIRRLERGIQDRYYMLAYQVDATLQNEFERGFNNPTTDKKEKEIKAILENSILDKKAKGIVQSMHILNGNRVFIQLMNNCDKYFSYDCHEKPYVFKKDPNIKYKLIEYEFNGTAPLDKPNNVLSGDDDIQMTIKPFDFKLFLIEFE